MSDCLARRTRNAVAVAGRGHVALVVVFQPRNVARGSGDRSEQAAGVEVVPSRVAQRVGVGQRFAERSVGGSGAVAARVDRLNKIAIGMVNVGSRQVDARNPADAGLRVDRSAVRGQRQRVGQPVAVKFDGGYVVQHK